MDLVSFLALMGQYGTVPALLVLAAVVAWLIRQLDANAKADAKRHTEDIQAHAALKSELIGALKESESRAEARMRTLEESHGELDRRMNAVERDYLTRDEHYRDFSGWRAEIDKLSKLIIELIKDVAAQGRRKDNSE